MSWFLSDYDFSHIDKDMLPCESDAVCVGMAVDVVVLFRPSNPYVVHPCENSALAIGF